MRYIVTKSELVNIVGVVIVEADSQEQAEEIARYSEFDEVQQYDPVEINIDENETILEYHYSG